MKLVLGTFDERPHPMHYEWIDDTWTLSDINPRHANIIKVDAKAIPFEGLEALYASHVVEHIAQEDLLGMFQHWLEVLVPGGYAVINVPDMEWVEAHLGEMDKKRLEEIVFGGRDTPHDLHRSWHTQGSLRNLLEIIGFRVTVESRVESHDMGCIIAVATKP